ncbi:hypothetical protein HU200_054351 [Digitaria exilis]|uniref:Reverse transcriptase zinc-binding domain-containing protein n=1 Tax=Digitaria exilis TaxID=1010633 RepID=A0A835AFP4_9POAL|nr:hypothetical protein HU200_054351 [Digitaria exilis]
MVDITDAPDRRKLIDRPTLPFTSKEVPRSLQCNQQQDLEAERVWQTRLPKKVQFFAWLLHHARLNCRAQLHRRNIRRAEESCCELCPQLLEDDDHIFTRCPQASAVWSLLTILPQSTNCRYPWLIGKELLLPEAVHLDVILMILWHLWKARNAIIFDHQTSTAKDIVLKVVHDMDRWGIRYKHHADD